MTPGVIALLRAALGDRVDTSPAELARARADKSGHAAEGVPLAIVRANSVVRRTSCPGERMPRISAGRRPCTRAEIGVIADAGAADLRMNADLRGGAPAGQRPCHAGLFANA